MLAKFFSKNEKLYIFEKPLTMPFQLCKKFADCLQKNYNFFYKHVQFVSLCQKLSKKLNFIKI